MGAQPLRLAVGSHKAGSGKGDAMNVISWENGDTEITDFPECADPFLAALVQRVNDGYCVLGDGDLLCPQCSAEVLALAHRTVGTAGRDDGGRVWVRIAVERARSVAARCSDPQASMALDVVDRWLAGDATRDDLWSAAAAARAAVRAADNEAARVAAWTADDVCCAAAEVAVEAADAAARTAAAEGAVEAAVGGCEDLMGAAREVFDRFEELTGFKAADPDPAVVQDACRRMLARTGVSS